MGEDNHIFLKIRSKIFKHKGLDGFIELNRFAKLVLCSDDFRRGFEARCDQNRQLIRLPGRTGHEAAALVPPAQSRHMTAAQQTSQHRDSSANMAEAAGLI